MTSANDQQKLIKKLQVFTINGRDRQGFPLLRIAGKSFPAKILSVEDCSRFLEQEIFPKLGEKPFSVLYINTGVNKGENFPGILSLKNIYDAIPAEIKKNLQSIFFLHSGIQSRIFMATLGRFIFTGGLYGKVKYASRLDILWNSVLRKEVEIPEFVYEEDEKMDKFPNPIGFGLESDFPGGSGGLLSSFDTEPRLYSLRCIA